MKQNKNEVLAMLRKHTDKDKIVTLIVTYRISITGKLNYNANNHTFEIWEQTAHAEFLLDEVWETQERNGYLTIFLNI